LADQDRKTSHLAGLAQPQSEPVPIVLVVEDEVLIRLDVADELRLSGFSVVEASSAEEALDLLASGLQVDVVFSDYWLLGALDGCELREAVEARYPGLPFILTSAQEPPADVITAQVPFLPKPYDPANVASLISNTMSKGMDEHGSA
jgi:DNA-binding NtrC family response regulator